MTEPEVFNIAMHPALVPAFRDWLAARDLHLAGPIAFDEGEPFYIIGINNDHPALGPLEDGGAP